MEQKLDHIASLLAEVREQVKLTNGRVTRLETYQAAHEAYTDAKNSQLIADERRITQLEQSVSTILTTLAEARGTARGWIAMASFAASTGTAIVGVVLQRALGGH